MTFLLGICAAWVFTEEDTISYVCLGSNGLKATCIFYTITKIVYYHFPLQLISLANKKSNGKPPRNIIFTNSMIINNVPNQNRQITYIKLIAHIGLNKTWRLLPVIVTQLRSSMCLLNYRNYDRKWTLCSRESLTETDEAAAGGSLCRELGYKWAHMAKNVNCGVANKIPKLSTNVIHWMNTPAWTRVHTIDIHSTYLVKCKINYC